MNGLGVLAGGITAFVQKRQGIFKYLNMIGFMAVAILILNWWVLWTIAIIGMAGWIIFESLGVNPPEDGQGFSIARFIIPMTVIVIGVFDGG